MKCQFFFATPFILITLHSYFNDLSMFPLQTSDVSTKLKVVSDITIRVQCMNSMHRIQCISKCTYQNAQNTIHKLQCV